MRQSIRKDLGRDEPRHRLAPRSSPIATPPPLRRMSYEERTDRTQDNVDASLDQVGFARKLGGVVRPGEEMPERWWRRLNMYA